MSLVVLGRGGVACICSSRVWWRSSMVPSTKVAPFPYLMWEVVLHCLQWFSPVLMFHGIEKP